MHPNFGIVIQIFNIEQKMLNILKIVRTQKKGKDAVTKEIAKYYIKKRKNAYYIQVKEKSSLPYIGFINKRLPIFC